MPSAKRWLSTLSKDLIYLVEMLKRLKRHIKVSFAKNQE